MNSICFDKASQDLVCLDTKMQGHEVHPFTAVTKSWCDLVELSALDLEEILIHRPNSLGRVRIIARLRWARLQAAAYVHSCVATLEKQQGRTFPPTKLRQVMKRLWSDCNFPGQTNVGGLDFTFSEIIGVEKSAVSPNSERRSRSENSEHTSSERQMHSLQGQTAEHLSQLVETDVSVQRAATITEEGDTAIDNIGLLAPSLVSCVGPGTEFVPDLASQSPHSQHKSDVTIGANLLASINEDSQDSSTFLVQKSETTVENTVQINDMQEEIVAESHQSFDPESSGGMTRSHASAHIGNLHLKFGGLHKGVNSNLSSSKHRGADQSVGINDSKKPASPAGAGRAEWKILYKMLKAGLGENRIGQKLLVVVAGKVGHFDWSRDWVDCHSSMAAEAEKLCEKYGSYAAAEHAFFMSAEEQLWPTPAGAPFSAVPFSTWDRQQLKQATGCNRGGGGDVACGAEAAAGSSCGVLESALGRLLTRIDAVDDATDVFRLHDDLRSLNLALAERARGAVPPPL